MKDDCLKPIVFWTFPVEILCEKVLCPKFFTNTETKTGEEAKKCSINGTDLEHPSIRSSKPGFAVQKSGF